jgi:hypothetical protein
MGGPRLMTELASAQEGELLVECDDAIVAASRTELFSGPSLMAAGSMGHVGCVGSSMARERAP